MSSDPTLAELQSLYQSMSDSGLLQIAAEGGLTSRAVKALAEEMDTRHLTQHDVANHVRRTETLIPAKAPFSNFVAYPLGIGITFRGKDFKSGSDFEAGIKISTRWVIILWLPIIPISTWRIVDLGMSSGFLSWSRRYEVIEKLPLNWTQIVRTWCMSGVIVLALIGLLSLISGA